MAKETWKDVKGYEGLYQVSDLGNVKGKNGLKKPRLNKHGYVQIQLSKNNIQKMYLIHRLVANAFIPNKMGYKEINHKDENKANNNVNNLEWCTRSYNIKYGTGALRRAQKQYKKINQYTLNNDFIKTWNSITEASKETSIKIPHIVRVCRGRRKSTGGYIWKYAKEVEVSE